MAYLLDTNCMWRRFAEPDPDHARVKAKIDTLLQQGEMLYVTAQNMIEFQALATRLTTADANREAKTIESLFPLLPDTPAIYEAWRTLMDTYPVRGRQVYDARLVAVMKAYSISHMLTMDRNDFQRFAGIVIEEP